MAVTKYLYAAQVKVCLFSCLTNPILEGFAYVKSDVFISASPKRFTGLARHRPRRPERVEKIAALMDKAG